MYEKLLRRCNFILFIIPVVGERLFERPYGRVSRAFNPHPPPENVQTRGERVTHTRVRCLCVDGLKNPQFRWWVEEGVRDANTFQKCFLVHTYKILFEMTYLKSIWMQFMTAL